MVTIKSSTKRGADLIARAARNEGSELSDIYGKYSRAKANALKECKAKCEEEGGKNFRICSHNGWSFSVAWNVKGGVRMETSSNSYLIKEV
jgi:hypothetical protein